MIMDSGLAAPRHEEAIEITNAVEYGLTSIVYTKDQLKADRAVRQIEAGMVWVK